ncbi:ABC transporter substrate-binding protein [Brachybacterium tyrofermentans]|uniref:ABC transporter substrate-binding protein n=1 Tax=Brachybacterium tyrofermentans TaxID=47848 RepID=UPI003FD62F63
MSQRSAIIPFSRRQLLGAGALAATVGSVAACGHSGRVSETDGLTFMMLGADQASTKKFTDDVLPAFTEQTGIDVTFQSTDWGSGFQKLTTAAASKTLPDVFLIGGIWTAPLADRGALLDLTDRLASWDDSSAFNEKMLADGAYEDAQYALPAYADTRAVVSRKDQLEAAGLDPAALPTDWDAYMEAAAKLSTSHGGPARFGASWRQDTSIGIQQAYAQLFFQAGGEYFDPSGAATFATDAGIRSLEFLMAFYSEELSSVNDVYSGSGPVPIVSGDAGLTFDGINTLQNAEQNDDSLMDQIVFGSPLSEKPGGTPVTCSWVNKLAISADTKDPDGAWELLTFLLGGDNKTLLPRLTGALPARTDVGEDDYVTGIPAEILKASEHAVTQPPHPDMLEIGPKIKTHLERAIRLEAGAEEILSDIDDDLDAITGAKK